MLPELNRNDVHALTISEVSDLLLDARIPSGAHSEVGLASGEFRLAPPVRDDAPHISYSIRTYGVSQRPILILICQPTSK